MKWLDATWWKGLDTLIGLDCPADPEGSYRLIRVRKDQHRIQVLHTEEMLGSEAIPSTLERFPKVPIVLILAKEFVMERLLAPDQAQNPVSTILGFAADEQAQFEGTILPASQGRSFVSLIRSDTIQTHLDRLGKHQSRVLKAACSKAIAMYLMPQANPDFFQGEACLAIDGSNYAFSSGLLDSLGPSSPNAKCMSEAELCQAHQIPSGYATAYGAILQAWVLGAATTLTKPAPAEALPPVVLGTRWRTHLVSSALKNIAITASLALSLWFVALFSLRMQEERRLHELEEAYSQNLPVLNAIQRLDEKIAERLELGEKLQGQTLKPSKASYYLDRIAARCPTDIRLTEAIVSPSADDRKRLDLPAEGTVDVAIAGESFQSAPIAVFSDTLQQWLNLEGNATPEKGALAVIRSEMDLQSGLYQFVFSITLPAKP